MKITAILENTTANPDLTPKHGLSVYIETAEHKILFDLGPDDTSLRNAEKLDIDLAEVDTVILSHGHYDHGGALPGFLEINDKAKLYFHRQAFEPHYHTRFFKKTYVGLDRDYSANPRVVFTGDTMKIDDELFLFSDVEGQFDTKSNRVLLKKTPSGYTRDDFTHEQNLIVTSGDKTVLFSGCSHRGIANIMRAAHKRRPRIQAVFGGFHLYNPATNAPEPPGVIRELAEELSSGEAVFYTCHCTGKEAYEAMRGIMGDRIRYFSTGSTVEL